MPIIGHTQSHDAILCDYCVMRILHDGSFVGAHNLPRGKSSARENLDAPSQNCHHGAALCFKGLRQHPQHSFSSMTPLFRVGRGRGNGACLSSA